MENLYCSWLDGVLTRVGYPSRLSDVSEKHFVARCIFDVPARREMMSDALLRPESCDAEVDASGLNCPLPLLKAKLELNRLYSGAVLKVISTDAGSQRDFRSFARLAGHALLHEEAHAGVYTYWLRKA